MEYTKDKSNVSTTNCNEEYTRRTRVEQMREIQDEGLKLFERKNKDYGDAFATYGSIGVIVRMGDKIHRLLSITNSGITMVNNESVYDTLLDLHNYSAMALMLLKERESNKILQPVSFRVEPQEIEHESVEFS
jgi:hypothetical protein